MSGILEEEVQRLLVGRGMRLAVAESCTGGLISHRLTDVPGSSRCFLGGIVAYGNSLKEGLLDVPPEVLSTEGAVSASAVRFMARGALVRTGADIVLAVSGIAGPGGGGPDKPVGLVFLAVEGPDGTEVAEHRFKGDRRRVKEQAAEAGLAMLRSALRGHRA